MVEGTVIKAYSGFYYVYDGQEVWSCRSRGLFRHIGQNVLVGDRVLVRPGNKGTGTVEKVLPRRSELVRPAVANVDQAVIIFALKEPDPNPGLLERFLLIIGAKGIESLICFNKIDLGRGEEVELAGRYRSAGYRVFLTSAVTGAGLDDLRASLQERISVVAGPSGVGKSTLLNAISPGLSLKTGGISVKLRQGKHTTRHVELLPLPGGGLVADTPGFSSLDLPDLKPGDLPALFQEIIALEGGCRFNGCMHHKEPDCVVKEAVEKGEIDGFRYRQYIEFLEELLEKRRRYH